MDLRAAAEELAELHDQRVPLQRIDVAGARDDEVVVGVRAQHPDANVRKIARVYAAHDALGEIERLTLG
jgi:hypothetical protein